jgi:hypothetical protein
MTLWPSATAFAALKDEDFLVLTRAKNLGPANSAIIAAGTGLGECTLYWDGKHHVPCHQKRDNSDFAPYDDLSTELIRYLRNKGFVHQHEQILSGPGLVNIYSFLRDTTGKVESADVIQAMRMERSGCGHCPGRIGRALQAVHAARWKSLFVPTVRGGEPRIADGGCRRDLFIRWNIPPQSSAICKMAHSMHWFIQQKTGKHPCSRKSRACDPERQYATICAVRYLAQR